MSDEYTPTTEHVRAQYARQENYDEFYEGDLYRTPGGQASAEAFDRWLTAELRRAKAEVLREAADDLERDNASPNLIELEGRYAGFYSGIRGATSKAIEKLRTRADKLEGAGRR